MFTWNSKSIDWFSKSANLTNFHKNIAKEIIPFVDNDSSLLSLGCGLGYLERELSSTFSTMSLVDIDPNVIDFLNKNKTSNQKIILSDSKNIKIKADYLLLSFYSRMSELDDLERYLKLVNKKIFYLVNERHTDIQCLISYLLKKKANFALKSLRLNFNQILEKNEINEYINHYYSNINDEKRTKLLNQFEEIDNNKCVFKNRKKIILVVISKGDK